MSLEGQGDETPQAPKPEAADFGNVLGGPPGSKLPDQEHVAFDPRATQPSIKELDGTLTQPPQWNEGPPPGVWLSPDEKTPDIPEAYRPTFMYPMKEAKVEGDKEPPVA